MCVIPATSCRISYYRAGHNHVDLAVMGGCMLFAKRPGGQPPGYRTTPPGRGLDLQARAGWSTRNIAVTALSRAAGLHPALLDSPAVERRDGWAHHAPGHRWMPDQCGLS